jgi:flagellar hook-length control protein FliK
VTCVTPLSIASDAERATPGRSRGADASGPAFQAVLALMGEKPRHEGPATAFAADGQQYSEAASEEGATAAASMPTNARVDAAWPSFLDSVAVDKAETAETAETEETASRTPSPAAPITLTPGILPILDGSEPALSPAPAAVVVTDPLGEDAASAPVVETMAAPAPALGHDLPRTAASPLSRHSEEPPSTSVQVDIPTPSSVSTSQTHSDRAASMSPPPLAIATGSPEAKVAIMLDSEPSTAPPSAVVSIAGQTAGAPPLPAAEPAALTASPRVVAAQVSPVVVSIAQRPAGMHQLTMTVNPESLGPVTVRAHITQTGDVRIELVGATDAGRDALRAIVADLRRDLTAAMPNATLSLSSAVGADAGTPERGMHSGAGEGSREQPPTPHTAPGAQIPRGAAEPEPHRARTAPNTNHAALGAGLDILV